MRVVEVEKLIEIFDEYEPDEWFESGFIPKRRNRRATDG